MAGYRCPQPSRRRGVADICNPRATFLRVGRVGARSAGPTPACRRSPEGCASILWKSADKAKDAAEQLGITAKRLLSLGLVDKVVREPIGGAHRNPRQMATRLKAVLLNELDTLEQLPMDELLKQRYHRLRRYGAYEAA